MILKEYQKRTLATVARFVRQLAEWREKDRAARTQDPGMGARLGVSGVGQDRSRTAVPLPPQRTR